MGEGVLHVAELELETNGGTPGEGRVALPFYGAAVLRDVSERRRQGLGRRVGVTEHVRPRIARVTGRQREKRRARQFGLALDPTAWHREVLRPPRFRLEHLQAPRDLLESLRHVAGV